MDFKQFILIKSQSNVELVASFVVEQCCQTTEKLDM